MRNYLIGVLAIFTGGLVYICFRPNSLLMFQWIDLVNLTAPVNCLRIALSPLKQILPDWFLYSAPNALWVFGGVMILQQLWGEVQYSAVLWTGLFILVAVGFEILQLCNLLPGVFDLTDMLFILSGIIAALVISRKVPHA